ATGAAQILPRHSACADLWRDVAAFVEPSSAYRYAFDCVEHQVVASEDVATVLDQLYRDPCALREYSARAYARATAPAFDWNTIAAQWDAVFQDVLARDQLVRSDR
ncbi:MAG: hypothetical protein JOZ51_15040, partial [Chloroflexi bacterium]|nr:hypothetical protein [Chloroflexota bacterium]